MSDSDSSTGVRSFGYGSKDEMNNIFDRAENPKLSQQQQQKMCLEAMTVMSERIRTLEGRIRRLETVSTGAFENIDHNQQSIMCKLLEILAWFRDTNPPGTVRRSPSPTY